VVPKLIAAVGSAFGVLVLSLATMVVSSEVRRVHVGPDTTSTLTYNLNRTRPIKLWPSWNVVRANSAHNVLVIDVETERVHTAREIAEQIVNPVRSRGYLEILIYVYKTGEPDAPMRRVQWTPSRGYVELAYGPAR
jgi:hypothetical protein